MSDCNVRVGDPRYQMYKLLKPIPLCLEGTIFYYDPDDKINGSIGSGCLKLAWTLNGNCQSGLACGSIVFHATARHDTIWFQKISICPHCGLDII
jgi:hypothetical protein